MFTKPLPERWQAQIAQHLTPGESILSWVESDLDERLYFHPGILVLTDCRLLAGVSAQEAGGRQTSGSVVSWTLGQVDLLRLTEQSGAGHLEALDATGRLGSWRFTAGQVSSVHRLVTRFQALRNGGLSADEVAAAFESVCPSCGAVVSSDELDCPACSAHTHVSTSRSLLRLARFASRHAGMALLGFGLLLLCTATELVAPYFTKPLIDNELIPHQLTGQAINWTRVGGYLGAIGIAAVFACLLGWAKTYVLAWVSERVAADMRNDTYAHLQKLSLEFFGGKRTGDLISRIGNDTDRICIFLSVNLIEFASDVVMIILTSVVLFSIDARLALATLLPFPLIAWLMKGVRSRLLRGFQQGSRAMARVTSVLADTIPGVRVVKAFAQEKREIERFRRANEQVLAANDRVNRVWSFFGPVVTLMTVLGELVVWVAGVWLVARQDHAITVGTLTLFLAYIGRFYIRLESMSRMFAATQRAGASAQRVFDILDRVPSVPEPVAPVHLEKLSGKIELRGVNFHYGARPIVQNVNLTIRPGEMIGLVGCSGAGKSTLVNLVCRFYDVSGGSIRVDDVDIRSLPVEEYRKHIGLVLQEPFLFYGTVAENIAYGKPDATPAEIMAAAKAARAHDFILRLPDGYDSLVGERGQSLSGGERQRISIARALLIDPKILILDEATSAVDTETEREIQQALDNLVRGRTTIAIAHRLSTLRKADRLVVMERGQIVEVGAHRTLLEKPGTYARLHRAQQELAGAAV